MEIEFQNYPKKKVAFPDQPVEIVDININENSQLRDEIEDKKIEDNIQNLNKKNSSHSVSHLNFEDNSNNQNSIRCRICMLLVLFMLHMILVYIIKPLSSFLQFIFLTTIVNINPVENQKTNSDLISSGTKVFGWLLIFIIPLYNFFLIGVKIIAVQDSFFRRLFTIIWLFLEIYFNIPLTFLYETNLYSIFLFEERGIEQLMSPWLIFYPTVYTLSIFEIIRNFLEPTFFIGIGFLKLIEIYGNKYQEYLVITLELLLVLSFLRIIGNSCCLAVRINRFCSNSKSEYTAQQKKIS